MFFFSRALAWMANITLFPLNPGLLPTVLCKYSNYSVQHPAKIEKKKRKIALWESLTGRGGRVTNKTNETIIPFAIGLS